MPTLDDGAARIQFDIHQSRWATLAGAIVALAWSAACADPAPQSSSHAAATNAPTAPAEKTPATRQPTGGGAPADPSAVLLAFKVNPGDVLYYVIENEFRESASLPMLGYSTYAKDRRYIIQTVAKDQAAAPGESPTGRLSRMIWECDRYEVRERGLKDEIAFDSLRDSYPPPSLHDLGMVPHSRATFLLDPTTGATSGLKITFAPVTGPPARRPLSRTAEKLQQTEANLRKLLDDLGPFFLPGEPKHIGDQWSRTYTEAQHSFGTVTTNVTCTLRAVRPSDDRQIATIDISSQISLQPEAKPAVPTTTRPGQRPPDKKEMKLERAVCKGTVEFDVTRGELVQMNLHRDLGFIAEMESQNSGKMQLRQGTEQILRVQAMHSPPPKPIIVGGPKPPKLPPEEMQPDRPIGATPALRKPLPPTTTMPTTRPAGPGRPRGMPTTPVGSRPYPPGHGSSLAPKAAPPLRSQPASGPTSQPAS